MLALRSSTLLRNTPELVDELSKWQEDSRLQKLRDTMASAINNNAFAHPIFKDKNHPKYLLMAHQNQQISLEQFTSFMLRWSALKDYGNKVKNLEVNIFKKSFVHHLTSFLLLGNFQNTVNIPNDKVRMLNAIMQDLYHAKVPESELTFYTFNVDKSDIAPIFQKMQQLGFNLFMPIENNTKGKQAVVIVVPSFTIIQTAIRHLTLGEIRLEPVLGDSNFLEVLSHGSNQYPFIVNFIGYEHNTVDGFKAGRFGFALYALYQNLLSSIPFRPAINSIADFANEFSSRHPESEFMLCCSNFLAEGIFRFFTIYKDLEPLINNGTKLDRYLNQAEFGFVVSFSAIVTRFFQIAEAQSPEKEMDIFLYRLLQKPLKIDFEKELPILRNLIAFLLSSMLNNPKVWQERGIDILKVVKFLDGSSDESCFLLTRLTRIYQQEGITTDNYRSDSIILIQTIYQQIIQGQDDEARHFQQYLVDDSSAWINKKIAIQQSLINFAATGNTQQLSELLSQEDIAIYLPTIDCHDLQKQTPLQLAVQNKHHEAAKLLMQRGANPHSPVIDSNQNSFKLYLLHIASRNEDSEMFQLLLKNGVNPYVYDQEKRSPVDYSIRQGDLSCLTLFLKFFTISDRHITFLKSKNEIHDACWHALEAYSNFKRELRSLYYIRHDRLDYLRRLIAKFRDQYSFDNIIDLPPLSEYQPDLYDYKLNARTDDSLLVLENDIEVIKILITDADCRVTKKDERGEAVLERITRRLHPLENSLEKMEFLIAYGALQVEEEHYRKSLLHLLNNKCHLILDFFLKERTPRNDTWEQLFFRLIFNMTYNILNSSDLESCYFALRLFLENGFDINTRIFLDFSNNTVLQILMTDVSHEQTFWAMLRGSPIIDKAGLTTHKEIDIPLEIRTLCIEHGANPNQCNFRGVSELLIAIKKGWSNYAALLIKKGANVMVVDQKGDTALHIAVMLDSPRLVSLLLATGASEVANHQGKTPSQLAALHSRVRCLKLLKPGTRIGILSSNLRLQQGGYSSITISPDEELPTTNRLNN